MPFQPHAPRDARPALSDRPLVDALERRTLMSSVVVTSDADSGAGTFRAALEQASADPAIDTIRFSPRVDTVDLAAPLFFTGAQDLTVDGSGAVIEAAGDAAGDFDLFTASGGGDLSLSRLTFRGGSDGVVVRTPADATGTVRVALRDVAITDNAEFGLHVDDLSGSPATIDLTLSKTAILRNGTTALDKDGVRVDERGEGGITARIQGSNLDANGAEGVELDEAGAGDVRLDVVGSSFNDNGYFSAEDYDDGIDVDEADAGDVRVSIRASQVNGNLDEGVDLNESGEGSLALSVAALDARGNTDEAVALEETDAGDLTADLRSVRLIGNSAEGFQAEEGGDGDLLVAILGSVIAFNDGDGAKVEQDDAGVGLLTLRGVFFDGNAGQDVDAEGVTVRRVGGPK